MGNSEKGHWVTVNGKHLFISDDPYEKKEREIADSKKKADKYNQSRQEKSDPVRDNALYKGLAEEADKVLATKDSDFESINDKYSALYDIISKFNANKISGDTYDKLQKEYRRVESVINWAYVNTGTYDKKVGEYAQKKLIEEIKKEHPNDYVSRYGVVLESPKGKARYDEAEYKKAFEKAGMAYLVDGQAESKDNPAGIVAKYKDWKGAKPTGTGSFEWGWFTDTDGKRKVWFFEAD